MPPMVVSEEQVRIFNYYYAGQLCQGMMCQNRLYRLISSFRLEERPKAYALGYKLNKKSTCTIITQARDRWDVWQDLRSGLVEEALL